MYSYKDVEKNMSNIKMFYNFTDDNLIKVISAPNYATRKVLKFQHLLALAELELIEAYNSNNACALADAECKSNNAHALADAECKVRTAKKQLEQAEHDKKICDNGECYHCNIMYK